MERTYEGIVEVRTFSLIPGVGAESLINELITEPKWVLLKCEVIPPVGKHSFTGVVYVVGRKES